VVDDIHWYLPSATRSPSSRRPGEGNASPLWDRLCERTAAWRRIWTSNDYSDTILFIKPADR
jgi:hypothetical protein